MDEPKVKLYATAVLCSVPGDGTCVRTYCGYTTAISEDEAKGKSYSMVEEEYGFPVLRVDVCFIPTEELITHVCEDCEEMGEEQHY